MRYDLSTVSMLHSFSCHCYICVTQFHHFDLICVILVWQFVKHLFDNFIILIWGAGVICTMCCRARNWGICSLLSFFSYFCRGNFLSPFNFILFYFPFQSHVLVEKLSRGMHIALLSLFLHFWGWTFLSFSFPFFIGHFLLTIFSSLFLHFWTWTFLSFDIDIGNQVLDVTGRKQINIIWPKKEIYFTKDKNANH